MIPYDKAETEAFEASKRPADEQVDPFVKRVVTVKPGDVVIFKYTAGVLTRDELESINAALDAKMGDIPYIVVSADIDLTVLKRPEQSRVPLIA